MRLLPVHDVPEGQSQVIHQTEIEHGTSRKRARCVPACDPRLPAFARHHRTTERVKVSPRASASDAVRPGTPFARFPPRYANLRLKRSLSGWSMTYLPPALQIGWSHEALGALLGRTCEVQRLDQPRAVHRVD